MIRVTLRDIRQAGHETGAGLLCLSGIRKMFESYQLDWDTVVREGLTLEQMQLFDNDIARRAVELAKERVSGRE